MRTTKGIEQTKEDLGSKEKSATLRPVVAQANGLTTGFGEEEMNDGFLDIASRRFLFVCSIVCLVLSTTMVRYHTRGELWVSSSFVVSAN